MKKSFLKKIINNANAKASNDRLSLLIDALYAWAKLNPDDKPFFLVIAGDKYNAHSAFFNSFGVTCDGAMAVSESPEMAGLIASLQGSVDLLIEDKQDDTEFRKRYEDALPDTNDKRWEAWGDYDPEIPVSLPDNDNDDNKG